MRKAYPDDADVKTACGPAPVVPAAPAAVPPPAAVPSPEGYARPAPR